MIKPALPTAPLSDTGAPAPRPCGRRERGRTLLVDCNRHLRELRALLRAIRDYQRLGPPRQEQPRRGRTRARWQSTEAWRAARARVLELAGCVASDLHHGKARKTVLAIRWLVQTAGDEPAGPWRAWPTRKRSLQEVLSWNRRRRMAKARASAGVAVRVGPRDEPLRALNLRQGPSPWSRARYGGLEYGDVRHLNFDVAEPPPPLALLTGEALEYLPPGLLREWACFAPHGPVERREPVAFASCWALVAASCLGRVIDGGLKVPVRDFAAIAGVGLANVVAGLDQDKWHAHNLDQALRGVAVATGVAGALQVTARRVARLEYAVHSAPLLRLLGKWLDELIQAAPPPQSSFDELLDRMRPSLVPVAELLRDRYPRLARNREIERAFGKATKAFGVVGMLRKHGGLVIQNHREAVAQDPDLATVPDGYRLAPGWE